MRVLFVSSEVAPFAKSGGLGDVSAALPRQLHALGHDVRIVMPLYPRARIPGRVFTEVAKNISLQLGPAPVRFSLYRSDMPNTARHTDGAGEGDDGDGARRGSEGDATALRRGTFGVSPAFQRAQTTLPVYFVHCPAFFDRPSLYGAAADEHLRFSVLTWAALKCCQHLGFSPDIAHVNDWQTALLPLIMRTRFGWDRLFENTKTVLTLHNLGHQGTFGAHVLPETGLGDSPHLFHQEELREGRLGYLLTGLLYADAITTVSPTYAREIQTPEQGVRLDPVLRSRSDALTGILNGIDENEWNPEKDAFLPAPFSSSDLSGKEICKQHMMSALKMPYRHDVPVIGLVSRLVWQKGLDLCVDILPHLMRHHRFQLVVLGKGEPRYEEFFRTLAQAWPHRVAYSSAFNEERAHMIEAGADMFLMPSRYEPCGLNQMYSLRYGTVPIVHKTGGLADTVWPFDTRSGRGTGFVFEHFDGTGFSWAIRHALEVWGTGTGKHRERWQHLQRNGMDLPFGWRHRIGRYLDVYERIRAS